MEEENAADILNEIISKLVQLNVAEKRQVSSDYCELVFYSKDAAGWDKVMGEIFGPPEKPQGKEPAPVQESVTEALGGIRSNQTLYKKEYRGVTAAAMYWPWADGEHVTLKIFFV
jgi:hypothetical protein